MNTTGNLHDSSERRGFSTHHPSSLLSQASIHSIARRLIRPQQQWRLSQTLNNGSLACSHSAQQSFDDVHLITAPSNNAMHHLLHRCHHESSRESTETRALSLRQCCIPCAATNRVCVKSSCDIGSELDRVRSNTTRRDWP